MGEDKHNACDKIDITRSKITQDIGVTIVTDKKGNILAISSNNAIWEWVIKEVTLDDIDKGLNVKDILHEKIVFLIMKGISEYELSLPPSMTIYPCNILDNKVTYVTTFLQDDGNIITEIEDFDKVTSDINVMINISNLINRINSKFIEEQAVNELSKYLFEVSSYDRIMTYKFMDDMSGEVVYELERKDTKSSFMGLRFPPGDIPLPARRAYINNPVRFISDIDKDSCILLQKSNTDVSMTQSFLRGCIDVHKNYLRNMGVKSSMSISITNSNGELWGIIAMHSYTKNIIPSTEDRVLFNILCSVASNRVKNIEKSNHLKTESSMKNLVSKIDSKKSLGMFIIQNQESIFETFNIDSVSLFPLNGTPTIIGKNPVDVKDIPISETPLLYGSVYNPPRSYVCMNMLGYKLIFTRESSYDSVKWAGNPGDISEKDDVSGLYMPRKSFEKYIIHSKKTPPPFTKQDISVFKMAGNLLKSVIHKMNADNMEKHIRDISRDNNNLDLESEENYAFFANMSHELRTPLHAITGVFDIINEMEDNDVSMKSYSRLGLETCTDMMKTLNDILSVVKNVHERKNIEVSPILINELFDSTCRGLSIFASSNDVNFLYTYLCDKNTIINIDAHLTIQILNNIAGNAIKFSKKNVNVEFSVLGFEMFQYWEKESSKYSGTYSATEECQPIGGNKCKYLVIKVWDDGCGIKKDNLSTMFKIFKQVGEVITKKFASTGLGLSISLKNITKMNGFMGVASTYEKGTMFMCSIPIEIDTTNRTKKSLLEESYIGEKKLSGHYNFVLVDDSKVNLMILEKHIGKRFINSTIYTEINGLLGFERIVKLHKSGEKVYGVFMDYHMPIMSGIESTIRIRKKLGNSIPISILTADITDTSRQAMISSGADFILSKPTRSNDVIKTCIDMINIVDNIK